MVEKKFAGILNRYVLTDTGRRRRRLVTRLGLRIVQITYRQAKPAVMHFLVTAMRYLTYLWPDSERALQTDQDNDFGICSIVYIVVKVECCNFYS